MKAFLITVTDGRQEEVIYAEGKKQDAAEAFVLGAASQSKAFPRGRTIWVKQTIETAICIGNFKLPPEVLKHIPVFGSDPRQERFIRQLTK